MKIFVSFAVSIAIGASLILPQQIFAKPFKKAIKFEDRDGGFHFAIKSENDRCIVDQVPGKGQMEVLMETACMKGRCFEFAIRPPSGYACEEGKLVKKKPESDAIPLKELLSGIEGECRELTPGSNRVDEKRWNLVFVGSDYHRIEPGNPQKGEEAFLWDIKAVLGENTNRGFFDLEPFRSLRKKFNIWTIDRFQEMAPVTEPYTSEIHEQRNTEAIRYARRMAQKCELAYGLENLIPIHLVPNKGTLDSGITIATSREVQLFDSKAHQDCQTAVQKAIENLPDQGRDGCKSSLPLTNDPLINRLSQLAKNMNLCPKKNDFSSLVEHLCASGIDNIGRVTDHGSTLAHEFGHQFLLYDTGLPAKSVNAAWDKVTIGNCFIAKTQSACLADAPWRSITGKKCVEGCIDGVRSFRFDRNSSYTYGNAAEGTITSDWDSLGKWNEWYLNQMIRAFLSL